MKTRTNARRMARGFSLLELTLVIAIMSVLMAVAAWNLIGGADDAKIRTTEASMKVVKDALQSYHLRNNAYPHSLQTLITETRTLAAGSDLDSWDQPLYYQPVGRPGAPKEEAFTLLSIGPDGQAGTDDDIDLWIALARRAK